MLIFIRLVAVLSLASCYKNDKSGLSTQESYITASTAIPMPTPEPTATPTPTPTPEPTATPAPSPTPTEATTTKATEPPVTTAAPQPATKATEPPATTNSNGWPTPGAQAGNWECTVDGVYYSGWYDVNGNYWTWDNQYCGSLAGPFGWQ